MALSTANTVTPTSANTAICTGASDRMHDCRARTVEKFRELPKEDRDAIVKFIDAI